MKNPQWDLQPAVTQLSPEEKNQLVNLLSRVGWQKTGKEIFEAIMFPIFPATQSECAIVRQINSEPHVLMLYRDDEHYTGYHMLGKYILRGESYEQWVRRTVGAEAGLELVTFEFIRCFNTRPETGWVPGHQMAHFWYCEVEGEPTNGKFYPLTAIPDDTLGHHKKYVDCLRAFLLRRTMMKVGIFFDGVARAREWHWLCVAYNPVSMKLLEIPGPMEFQTLGEAEAMVRDRFYVGDYVGLVLFDDMGQEIYRSFA
ncbi:MAG: hypothetical protein G01um101470_159 [Parcubacteria group bacterium Gr01-1014_70]|nr:MAG: hypothetical protein G01um101470_159 [Parcubacteria group bacterium Gr01-1014_70]